MKGYNIKCPGLDAMGSVYLSIFNLLFQVDFSDILEIYRTDSLKIHPVNLGPVFMEIT